MLLIGFWHFTVTTTQTSMSRVARAIDRTKGYDNLEFVGLLKDKRIACIQNIVDGRDVVNILKTFRGEWHAQVSTLAQYVLFVKLHPLGDRQTMCLRPDFLLGEFMTASENRISANSPEVCLYEVIPKTFHCIAQAQWVKAPQCVVHVQY